MYVLLRIYFANSYNLFISSYFSRQFICVFFSNFSVSFKVLFTNVYYILIHRTFTNFATTKTCTEIVATNVQFITHKSWNVRRIRYQHSLSLIFIWFGTVIPDSSMVLIFAVTVSITSGLNAWRSTESSKGMTIQPRRPYCALRTPNVTSFFV